MAALSPIQLDDVLSAAGFIGDKRRQAWAVAMRESRGTPSAISPLNGNGSRDYGLFQINTIHQPALERTGEWDRILDPYINAGIASRFSKGGADWSAWGLGDTGWAGYIKRVNPTLWETFRDRYLVHYNAYPGALERDKGIRTAGVVSLLNLRPGLRNADVTEYQRALRRFVGADMAEANNPSGATGFYGFQTSALTTISYDILAGNDADSSWLRGDLTIPGPGLIRAIGLRTVL